jgi:glycosyltransferase involved in cell wall biosynthesis
VVGNKILIVVADSRYFLSHRMDLALFLKSEGYCVEVATDILKASHRKKMEEAGFVLHPIPRRPASLGFLYSFILIHSMRRLLKKIQPDCVLSVSFRMVFLNLIAWHLSLSKATRFYGLITGLGFLALADTVAYRAVRWGVMRALSWLSRSKKVRLIVQNLDDRDLLTSLIASDRLFVVLGSGVDTVQFAPNPKPLPSSPIVVSMVSRMLKDKGVVELVEAARILRAQSDIPFVIQLVGDPYAFNPSSIACSKLKSWHDQGLVHWLGARKDITLVYQQSHIAVLPSYREGLPKSLLEAASCGLPLLTTDVPGCRAVCEDKKNGLLVAPKDSKSLADALLLLMSDESMRMRMGLESRRRVEACFSSSVINKKMLAIFNEGSCSFGESVSTLEEA